MILVVYSHICGMCLGDKWMGWNDVFFLFRLPCFFFISGWLFEQVGRQWNSVTIRHTVRHKFMVQIVPTVIFLLLLAPPPLFFSRLGATKGGYWFTFALFEFFILCILSERYLRKWSGVFAIVISAAAFCYDIYYNRLQMELQNVQWSMFNGQWITDVLGFLSFMTWRYYLFFFVGTWVKRHFEAFVSWTSKPWVIIAVIVSFICIALIPHSDHAIREYLLFALGGIFGLTMVFTFFRTFARYFTRDRWLGRSLIYIGTRTLDIYLLHYFVLPRFLILYSDQLRAYDSRLLEFVIALSLALVVIAVCLLASYIIRLSPFMGHYLFGVKYERQK
jgi:fucose 4-O-acetylase-like acetyltransferase